jgi:aspartyl-tRNA(Asn)/glutamyl-tRNA(Gln) amidotransferase subunit B
MALKIGLEIHGYLTTKEKLFCRCRNEHKKKEIRPNTLVCPICCGYPGSKPMLPNKEALIKLIKIGLMLNCSINHEPKKLVWYRKHYSWPDLPKGYQNTISGTYATPVGEKGKFLGIGITEAHIEEDPAAWNPDTGEIDYNRSGVPLVEIVTEPDFKSAEQVAEWLEQLVLTLSYINALDSDAGIKVDVNISTSGERVEIKNMNSISEIVSALRYEEQRQEKEKVLKKETRRWDNKKGETIKMRDKESHADYRFIKDPDLPEISLTKEEVHRIKQTLPESPFEKMKKLIKQYKIAEYDAKVLTSSVELINFFDSVIKDKKVNIKTVVPWITTELLGMLNKNKKKLSLANINPLHFINLILSIEENKITELKAKEILRGWKDCSSDVKIDNNSIISNRGELDGIVEEVINAKENKKAIEDFKSGNMPALNFLIGAVMKKSDKRADYKTAKEILENKLK